MTRNGKIARLPREIRDELNQRLDDGAQGKDLVEWLNSLADVKEILSGEFGGEPISEQNLSRWKQGGFPDWQRQQERREAVSRLVEMKEAQEQALHYALSPIEAARRRPMLAMAHGGGPEGAKIADYILEVEKRYSQPIIPLSNPPIPEGGS